jgi:hypothetical protein
MSKRATLHDNHRQDPSFDPPCRAKHLHDAAIVDNNSSKLKFRVLWGQDATTTDIIQYEGGPDTWSMGDMSNITSERRRKDTVLWRQGKEAQSLLRSRAKI